MKLRFLQKESIIRSVLTLASGTVVAQIIALLIQPVLRRIISVEDFGAYAIYMGIVGIVAGVITLRYDMAVVIPEKDEKASALVVGGIGSAFLISFIFFLLILFFSPFFMSLLGLSQEYSWWFYFLPFTLFFAASYRMFSNWLIRKKKFARLATNKGLRRSGEAVAQTGIGTLHLHGSLIVGELFGSAFNFFLGLFQSVRAGFKWKVGKEKLKQTLKEYSQFPKYNIFPVLLNNAAAWLPVFFINHLFSTEITGQYDLTRQVFAITLSLISMSVAQVYLQRIADMRNKKHKILPDILRVSKLLGAISLAGVLITLLAGPFIFGLVFGSDYEVSGFYAQIMIFSFAIRLVVSPLSIVFVNLERLKLNAIWQIAYFLGILSLLLFDFSNMKMFLYTNMLIDVVAYLIYYLLILHVSKQHDNQLT